MTITFGLVGNRPDVGHLIAASEADRLTLGRAEDRSVAWGVGFFQADEVLLRRRPSDPRDQVSLAQEVSEVRAHALLGQMRRVRHGELTTESTPPLRFGHLLFSSTLTSALDPEPNERVGLKRAVLARMPAFLHPTVGSGTLTELLLGLFLSALPHAQLERSRDVRASRGALDAELIRSALRAALEAFDQLLRSESASPFEGDIWICSGEQLVIAHRAGLLHLRVFRSRRELAALSGGNAAGNHPHGADLAYAVGVLGVSRAGLWGSTEGELSVLETPSPGWERLPDQTMITIGRTGPPETASLVPADPPSSIRPEKIDPSR